MKGTGGTRPSPPGQAEPASSQPWLAGARGTVRGRPRQFGVSRSVRYSDVSVPQIHPYLRIWTLTWVKTARQLIPIVSVAQAITPAEHATPDRRKRTGRDSYDTGNARREVGDRPARGARRTERSTRGLAPGRPDGWVGLFGRQTPASLAPTDGATAGAQRARRAQRAGSVADATARGTRYQSLDY